MNKYIIVSLLIILNTTDVCSQQAYFADGYHGGIYGHYPVEWKTKFIVDQLKLHLDWRIGLEIEPETWDTVKAKTPEDYARFKEMATGTQMEFTNPTYAQPYCYNISGESIIRQFQYGIDKIHSHFPEVDFLTYSVEEPCFTSCLPQLLKQFGFKYAVLKCPNTCWGGYTQAYGGELVNWIGPDNTSILTVPRYACEKLEKNSTWQTTAWANEKSYIQACLESGIKHPVGMCYQDAGWKNGPWLKSGNNTKNKSIYVRWRDYFSDISIGKTNDDWHFSQEDMRVNLMWGSQVLQRIAQEVRTSENKVIAAEKMGVMAYWENGYQYAQPEMDEVWRTLMLAQHHDSWIVPYNGLRGYGTWADAIRKWTDHTNSVADAVISQSLESYTGKAANDNRGYIRVYNTLGTSRKEVVKLLLPASLRQKGFSLQDSHMNPVDCTVQTGEEGSFLCFEAEVPAFGYATYWLQHTTKSQTTAAEPREFTGQEYVMENDCYRIVFDLSRGGTIKSLIAKRAGNRDFAKQDGGKYAVGELRGFFYEEGKFRSSAESPACLKVIADNPLRNQVEISGTIAGHPFVQTITLTKGDPRIDFDLTINWKENVGIGEYKEQAWREDRRAYCDDRYKLRVLFPTCLEGARISKDAPFDVCESRQENTYFNRWSDIKHNIILHWVDLSEGKDGYGLALLSDHTTSYSHGEGDPLGLTIQYSGQGLWGPDYKITRPTRVKYAIVPHRGTWDKADISSLSDCWNEPLVADYRPSYALKTHSFIDLGKSGYQVSAAHLKDGAIILRLYNASGDSKPHTVSFGMPLGCVEEVDLNGRSLGRMSLKPKGDRTLMSVSMPRFGIRTYRLELNQN